MIAAPVVAAAVLAVVHLFAERLRFLEGLPRSRWLSIAGGISVSYVVVHLLPELAAYQETVGAAAPVAIRSLERHLYVLALVGLAVFYGVEIWARRVRRHRDVREAAGWATALGLGTYALYNGVIGYLLVRREGGLVLFAVAMGLHFVVNDHGLRQHHRTVYRRYGRWLLSGAVLGGAAVGLAMAVPEPVVGLLLAFIGGGTLLNVLKEELPAERDSRFGAFAAGAGLYTALLLVV